MATVTDHIQRLPIMSEEEIRLATSDPSQAQVLRMLSLVLEKQDSMEQEVASIKQTIMDGKIANVKDDGELVRRIDKIEQRQAFDRESSDKQSQSNKWLINLTITIFGIIISVMMAGMAIMASHIQWVGPK